MSTNPTRLCTSVGKGNWKVSEALNTSKTFHIIEGLEPGTEYTVRLMTNNWVDNSSIFEDVIKTRAKGEKGYQRSHTKTDSQEQQLWLLSSKQKQHCP